MEEEKKEVSNYGKRPLWQWVVLYVVVAGVIYGLVYYFVLAKSNKSYSANSSYSTMKTTPSPKPTTMMQKFSASSDFQYSYKIFPGILSTESKQAMSGFAFTTKAMPDGSAQVTLTAQNPEYTTQQYTVKPGDTLYFIERNLKDDDPKKDTDANMHDDTAILVNPQGYIVQ